MVRGIVTGALRLGSSAVVEDRLSVTGRVSEVVLGGTIRHECVLTPGPDESAEHEAIWLRSVVGARFDDEVFIGDRVRIDDCDFRQCADLGQLRLIGSDLFPTGHSVLAQQPTNQHSQALGPVPDSELATIYRQLRSNLERRNDRPSAGRFYVGETNARRRDAKTNHRRIEWFVLSAYWALSGYGLKASRALGWFAVVAAVGSAGFLAGGLDLDPASARVELASVLQGVIFTVKSMVSFFSPPTADLTEGEELIQLGLRFAGPILLAQAILAIRERVAR